VGSRASYFRIWIFGHICCLLFAIWKILVLESTSQRTPTTKQKQGLPQTELPVQFQDRGNEPSAALRMSARAHASLHHEHFVYHKLGVIRVAARATNTAAAAARVTTHVGRFIPIFFQEFAASSETEFRHHDGLSTS